VCANNSRLPIGFLEYSVIFWWLCLFDIPIAYSKIFGCFFFPIFFVCIYAFNTRREITMLDEVLVCMTLHCVCRVSLYRAVQFRCGNAWNKKGFPIVDLWSLLMRLNAGSSGVVTHLYPDLTPLVISIHSRFIWYLVLIEWCTAAIRCKTTKGAEWVRGKFLICKIWGSRT